MNREVKTRSAGNELDLLYELGRSFTTAADLPELFARTVDASMAMVNAGACALILRDLDTGRLVVRASRPSRSGTSGPEMQPVDDPLIDHAMKQQQPLRLDPGQSPAGVGNGRHGGPPRLIIPLISKGQAVGILDLADPASRSFTRRDEQLLAGLAGYAAAAIENTLLYRQAMDTAAEMRLLVDAANALSWSLDLGQVLNAITRHMMRSLDTHWATVCAWDPATGVISRLAERRHAIWDVVSGPGLTFDDQPYHQRSLRNARPLAISISDDLPSGEREALQQRLLSRLLSVPILLEGQTIGLAEVASAHATQPFSTEQTRASIHHAIQLAPLLSVMADGPPPAELARMLESLARAMQADWCTSYYCSPDSGRYYPLAAIGQTAWLDEPGQRASIADFPTLQVVLAEQRLAVLHRGDPDLSPAERHLFDSTGDSTLLGLPLVSQTRTVGLVLLHDLSPARQFTSRELALARALANQAAVALENAGLVRDLQTSLAAQRTMQSHLVRAARLSALGEMSAVVAHQINNPLTIIIGDATLLLEDIAADSPLHDSASAVLRAGERARRVVERMLNLARHEDQPELISMNHTIREILELIGVQVRESGIDLVVNLTPDLPLVRAIPGQLEDVWMNLLLNARDATLTLEGQPRKVSVQSSLADGGQAIEVRITDNGGGISPDHLKRIFDPMFTTKPRGKGTGLGLYICRQVVADHGGRIEVSSAVGEGTTITVHLPAYAGKDGENGSYPRSGR